MRDSRRRWDGERRRTGLIEGLFRRLATRRLKKELRDYRDPPELKTTLFRRRYAHERQQVFRSLVQINFYPRPR